MVGVISQVENGCQAVADSLLVFVPHKTLHETISILVQLRLPRHRRVCKLCHTRALGDERQMLLECPALADLRDEFSPLIAECSGVMTRLVWAKNQPMVSRYIITCLGRMSC